MVLALSDESTELVEPYVEEMGINVRVAAGFNANDTTFQPAGYPTTYIVGGDGKILWTGHPSSLDMGVLKDALKGLKKSSSSYLAFQPSGEYTEKEALKLVDLGQQGKLAKALKAAQELAASPDAGAAAAQAKAYAAEAEAYVALLKQQAEAFIGKRQMVTAVTVLNSLSAEFKGTGIAASIDERLAAIAKDETLSKELEADQALQKLKEGAAKKGWGKSVKKLEALIKKYEGTVAAKKAKALLRKANAE